MSVMRVLSLGWGVQSFTLAAMSALGEIERFDTMIHADTTHERSGTYDFARRWQPWLEGYGSQVVTVSAGNTRVIDGVSVTIPAFTTDGKSRGQLRRQCTNHWKIYPIRRWLQANRNRQPVEMNLGISLDEFQRMKTSDRQYITNRWPLVEMGMTRQDCESWLHARGLEIPVKSSCVFCPYLSKPEYRNIKAGGNGDWTKAVNIDVSIRHIRPPHALYIHQSRTPIEQVDLRTPQEKGQLNLWNDECSGLCGV